MKPDEKQKPTKGILSTIWESMTKTGGCCGGGGNCCGAPPPSAGKPKTASQKNAPSSNSGK